MESKDLRLFFKNFGLTTLAFRSDNERQRKNALSLAEAVQEMVTPGRFELPTCGLGNRRAIHLSYGAILRLTLV